MAVRKITEQQFRTRRKDRKMVWVDAAAVLVGMIILTVSVGGVIIAEPELEPYPYGYSFFETKMMEKHCVEDPVVVAQAGCTHYPQGDTEFVPEGAPTHLDFAEVTAPNVTQVSIRLSFVDQAEETSEDGKSRYAYDANATDTIRLTITTPWGEVHEANATNDLKQKSAEILMQFNFSSLPEDGIFRALSMQEVYDAVIPENTVTDHEALGVWRAEVLVERAGDQEGSLPPDACAEATGTAGLPPPEAEECDITGRHRTFEGTTPGQTASQLELYTSYEADEGNGWLLEFVVRAFDVTVSG